MRRLYHQYRLLTADSALTVVVLITPVSIGSIGWKTYVYFGVFNACFVPAIYFFCKSCHIALSKVEN
jgi:hypothetical protein